MFIKVPISDVGLKYSCTSSILIFLSTISRNHNFWTDTHISAEISKGSKGNKEKKRNLTIHYNNLNPEDKRRQNWSYDILEALPIVMIRSHKETHCHWWDIVAFLKPNFSHFALDSTSDNNIFWNKSPP